MSLGPSSHSLLPTGSQQAPIFLVRYEKKYGRDESDAQPRCLMAAKFISNHDPTGEVTLKHWIAQGQIQDLVYVFRIWCTGFTFDF